MSSSEVMLRLRVAGQKQAAQGIDSVTKSVDKLGRESKQTSEQTHKTGKETEGLGNKSKKSSISVGALARKAVALGAGLASIAAAKNAIDTTTSLGDATIRLSRSFGLNTEVASNWAVVAKARGIDTNKMSMSFTNLSKNAAKGDKAFKQLGVSQATLKRGNLQEILQKTSDGLAKMPAGTNRAAIASKLFGKSWSGLRPLLFGGSKAMKEQLALAEKFVPGFGKSAGSVEKLRKAQREAKYATIGLQVAAGKLLLPAMTKLSEKLASSVKFLREHKTTASALKVVLIALTAAYAVGKIVKWASAIRNSMVVTKLAAAAQWLFNAAMSANPIVLVIAAVVALAAIFYVAYKKSKTFRDIVHALWGAMKSAFGWVKKNWPLLLAILGGPIGLAVLAIVKNFDKIKDKAGSIWKSIKSIFGKGADILGTIFKAPVNAVITVLKKIKIDIKSHNLGLGVHTPAIHLDPFGSLHTLDTGGRVTSGGAVVVGGTGPEILHLNQGDSVTNPRKAKISRPADPATGGRLSRAGAAGTVTLNLIVNNRQFARAVVDAQELEAALS